MHEFKDDEMKGIALVFDSPLDLLHETAKACQDWSKPEVHSIHRSPWVRKKGRQGTGWEQVLKFMGTPWPEAVEMIQKVLDRVDRSTLPQPKSVKRQRRWNENDGEISVDRALNNDPLMFREASRELVAVPTTISLLANLETFTLSNEIGVYWRSAAAIATVDILESLGYSCELWLWCAGRNVFVPPYPHQFVTALVKEAGTPLDIHNVCDVLSSWFTTIGIFGSFHTAQAKYRSLGRGSRVLGGWRKHMQTSGAMVIEVPLSFGGPEALKSVEKMLQDVINWTPGCDENTLE